MGTSIRHIRYLLRARLGTMATVLSLRARKTSAFKLARRALCRHERLQTGRTGGIAGKTYCFDCHGIWKK